MTEHWHPHGDGGHHHHPDEPTDTVTITTIIGACVDPMLSKWLHEIRHHGHVETIRLEARDMARRRLRVTSDLGTECMIALPRTECLFDGAVLLMEDTRAIVVRASVEHWLRLRPASSADALALGYAAGNLHWRVRFSGRELEVAIDGEPETYLARISELLDDGRVAVVAAKADAPA